MIVFLFHTSEFFSFFFLIIYSISAVFFFSVLFPDNNSSTETFFIYLQIALFSQIAEIKLDKNSSDPYNLIIERSPIRRSYIRNSNDRTNLNEWGRIRSSWTRNAG